jgi:hypothetical protein
MRYLEIANVSFTNALGKTYNIKDLREFPNNQTKAMTIKLKKGDSLDEIANRRDIYGADSEISIYQIFDFNKVAITEAGFDLDKLKSLDIPNLL